MGKPSDRNVTAIDVTGIDVWKGRWVAIVLRDGRYLRASVSARIGDLLDGLGEMAAVGIDMPIGLTSGRERRLADGEARAFVGPRGSTVFPTYPREVYLAASYAEARRVAVDLTSVSISSQAYALRERLLELESVAAARPEVHEVHPEVSFCAMAGGRHLAWPKRSWNGFNERLALLRGAGIELPAMIDEVGGAGIEDVLDAAAAAWSANRIARGQAGSLPREPRQHAAGRPLAIWY